MRTNAGTFSTASDPGEYGAMALLDVEGVAAYESDAKRGKVDALYTLGLAFSTGQGVSLDLIAAHKWFNLAAMRGSVEAREMRAEISKDMSAPQIAEAQRQARAWLAQLN